MHTPRWSRWIAEQLFHDADAGVGPSEFHPWGFGFRGFLVEDAARRHQLAGWAAAYFSDSLVRLALALALALGTAGWLCLWLGVLPDAPIWAMLPPSATFAVLVSLSAWFFAEHLGWHLGVRRHTRHLPRTRRMLGRLPAGPAADR
jgi:hypothetical protein